MYGFAVVCDITACLDCFVFFPDSVAQAVVCNVIVACQLAGDFVTGQTVVATHDISVPSARVDEMCCGKPGASFPCKRYVARSL